jgi:hypothetical protein
MTSKPTHYGNTKPMELHCVGETPPSRIADA